jgi:hypothetical protein
LEDATLEGLSRVIQELFGGQASWVVFKAGLIVVVVVHSHIGLFSESATKAPERA